MTTPTHGRNGELSDVVNGTADAGQHSEITPTGIINEVNSLVKAVGFDKRGQTEFPIEVFPEAIQNIIAATVQTLNFPVDFIGASLLYAASVAIGNTYRVKVKRGHLESAVIYLALVARPGINKTHPLYFAISPILEADRIAYAKYEDEKKEYDRIIEMSKKTQELEGIKNPGKPFWKKYLLSDYTPEALSEVLKLNKRGNGIYVDELAGWFKNFNRYNRGSEMEFWLSAWSSKPINVDRKSGDPLLIPIPFISVAGTIQVRLLKELAKDSRSDNGFIDRILFAFLDQVEKPCWNEKEIDQAIIDHWHQIVAWLLNLPFDLDDTNNPQPIILDFASEAKKELFEWQRNNTDQCNSASDAISSIYSKMDMYAVRLSLILELLTSASEKRYSEVISIEAVRGAIKLTEYFKMNAVEVNSIISNSNPLDRLPDDRRELYNALSGKFTTEEGLQVAIRTGVPERTFKRFLTDSTLFRNCSRGVYEKKI